MTRLDRSIHRRNQGLDGARCAAILGVLVAHFLGSTKLRILGPLGVELFFALSGYLIGRILFRMFAGYATTSSLLGLLRLFWMRRWMRTLPAYWLALILETVCWVTIWHGSIKILPKYLFFVQNFSEQALPYFFVSWSLSIEEWFYFLFPFGVMLAARRCGYHLGVVSCWIAGWIAVFTATRWWYASDHSIPVVRTLVIARLDSISFGVIVAYAHTYLPRAWDWLQSISAFVVGLLLVIIGAFLSYSENPAAVTATYSMIPVGFATSLGYISTLSTSSRPLSAAVSWGSRLSYSLYLIHVLIFSLVDHYFATFYDSYLIKIGFRLTALLVSMGVAALIYHYIEMPCMNLRDKWYPDR